MIRRLILLAAAVVLTCMSAMAAPDDIKCSGVLVGEDGEPIIGATITVPGTKIVATTDVDGRFSLNVPKGRKSMSTTSATNLSTSKPLQTSAKFRWKSNHRCFRTWS